GNGYQHNGDNININVNNFNRISGQNLPGQTMGWQHNPAWRNGLDKPRGQRVMSDDVLETYIRRVIDDTPSSEVSFCWQGGEPTL
ncbi:hypothetical protein ONQ60_25690, partial [Salmonella enterica subsp. enterica serovar Virginia]|nr:hypothetical protein [Salmonella enterica subsp. enterica serovar Virginia]